MRKDILIKVNTKTSRVDLPTDVVGITGENLQGKLIFQLDEFINGTADLLVHQEYDNTSYDGFIEMEREGNLYTLEIKNSLLKGWKIDLQLRITEAEKDTHIPVFKSNKFFLKVEPTLNDTGEIPDEYPSWIETANAKINEINELMESVDEDVTNALQSVDDKIDEVDTKVANGDFNGESVTNVEIINGELIVTIDKVV